MSVPAVRFPAWQRGAALVEFAFVLPILLALLIGVIYYGYAFMLKSAVTYAAKEGAQAAVAVDPTSEGYAGLVQEAARQAASNSLDWLSGAVDGTLAEPEVTFPGGDRVRVRVMLPTTGGGGGLLPQATLPFIGAVPPLPATLVGVAEVAL